MFIVPIDRLFTTGRFLAYGLVLLMPITLLAGSRLMQLLTRKDIPNASLLLTIRLFVAIIVLVVSLHVITLTGHISLICERPSTVTCQRERTLLYGLLKQETVLPALNPSKQYKSFRAEEESPYQLMLQAAGQSYLLHPAHQFSRLEQVTEGKHRLLTIDEAIADMQRFQLGDAGAKRHYRDRVGIAGNVMTILQVIAIMPVLLVCWLFAEAHFGHRRSQHHR